MTEPESITLAACGDILLHGRYQDIAARGQAQEVFADLESVLAEADLVVGNMETVLTKEGQARDDKLCLRTDPDYARALEATGVQLLTLANNHCLDYGPEGLAETRRHLEAAGIQNLGAGADIAEATRPIVIERNGLRIGFIAACHESTKPAPAATADNPGIAPLKEDTLFAAVDALKPDVDHLILLLHWGLEYAHYPTPEQVALARGAINRGASVVIGHHSHALQGIEAYRGGVIAYSLANLTDADLDWKGPGKRYQAKLTDVDRESVLLRLRLTRNTVETLDPIPLWLEDDGRPTPATGERAEKIDRQLVEYSRRLSDSDLDAFWQDKVIKSRVAGPLQDWWSSGSLWDKLRGFRPGQLQTLYLLGQTYLRVRFSHSESKWLLFNSRNDTRPMPASEREDKREQ